MSKESEPSDEHVAREALKRIIERCERQAKYARSQHDQTRSEIWRSTYLAKEQQISELHDAIQVLRELDPT